MTRSFHSNKGDRSTLVDRRLAKLNAKRETVLEAYERVNNPDDVARPLNMRLQETRGKPRYW